MDWKNQRLTSGQSFHYTRTSFDVVKEKDKSILVKLNQVGYHDYKGLSTWLPKSVIRDYNGSGAYVWDDALSSSIRRAQEYEQERAQKIKEAKELLKEKAERKLN
jgi:hypothetical protein